MSDEVLQPGEQFFCPRCRETHVLEHEPETGTSPYAQDMLFFTCRGTRYYAGQIGYPKDWRTSSRAQV
jgi:hypothetical protein